MTNRHGWLASLVVTLSFAACIDAGRADDVGPLPSFEFKGVVLHPENLKYTPTGDLIHPTIVKTEGRVENALGKYYLYYAPHKHVATSMAYSDSMDGPWTEYAHNPVVEGPSAPDCRWIAERGEFFLWGHTKNSQTELWTSKDGIHFEHHSVSVTAKNIGTRNATYSRMYEYPLEKSGSKYVMVYSGFDEDREIRCVWLAHSKDAINWTQLTTPLVEPIEGENNDCYGPSLLQWKGRNFVVYQDHTTWRGGNVKYVEVDRDLSPVGAGGRRYVLLDPPAEPPLNDRYRGGEFYRENGKLYLYSSASRNPRLIVYLTAEDDVAEPPQKAVFRAESEKGPSDVPEAGAADGFPSANHLAPEDKLPDPFQFFGTDRRVKTKEEWKQRQAEMIELLKHYVYGPAFPPVGKYEVESRTKTPLGDSKVVKHSVSLKLGPERNHPVTVVYYLPADEKSPSLLFNVLGKEDPKDEDAMAIAKRGYAYAAVKVGASEKIARSIYPEIRGTRSMAWVWGMNEILTSLTREYEFDKVVVTGCSRYGRVAALVGALNERVDLTAPITTLAHAVHLFDETMWGAGNEKWATQEYGTFAGKMNRLPVDRHFIGAAIAPRAYLGIMGAEKPAFEVGHVEAHEALAPVYEWLGVPKNVGLYDHSPRGHGVELDDLHTVLDFADLVFEGKSPESGKTFDRIANPDLVGFEWKAPATVAE